MNRRCATLCGLKALEEGSTRPHTIHAAFDPPAAEKLRALLHQSPRAYGKPSSLWTLQLAAEVSFQEHLVSRRVSREAVRRTLARMGIRWKRAKHWITSPDEEYERKKALGTA